MNKRINSGIHLLSGNQAVAEGALAAGLQTYFGYPITPSTSIMEHVVKRIKKLDGDHGLSFLQCEDEIASITAVIGASWTRKKSMTATSGPGFSLMQEGIGLAAFTETPLVLVNVMRGGPSTGLPTFPAQQEAMQAHFGSHGDYLIPTLVPASIQECFDFTVQAFNIAEALRTPVFVLSDQILSSLKERLIIPEEIETISRSSPKNTTLTWKGEEVSNILVPPMNCFGEDEKSFGTGLSHDETGHVDLSADTYEKLLDRLHEKIEQYGHLMPQPTEYEIDDAEVVLVAYGSTARSCRRAMIIARQKGLKVGVFKINTLWPFPVEQIQKATIGKIVIVVEMSRGQLIWPVERYLGKVNHLPYYRGAVPHPSIILDKIASITMKGEI